MSTVDTHGRTETLTVGPDDTQPLPRRDPGTTLDALVAELAVAEKWPTPEGYCHRCDNAPCVAQSEEYVREDDGTCNYDLAGPFTLDTWLSLATADALLAAGLFGTGADKSLIAALAKRISIFAV